jgi:RNA polymerase sigma factor (sigma-70 family)
VRDVEPHSRLDARQEQDLVVAAEAGDPEARRRLVETFLPLIAATARRYDRGMAVERQDLIQEGVAGLLFAAQRYDASLNTPFWAYASFWVRKAMQELVAELSRPVALSDRAVRGLAQIRAARGDYLQAHGVEPSTGELSSATGFTPAQLESLQATERMPRAMEEPLSADGATAFTVGDMVIDPVAEQAYQEVLDCIEIRAVRELADQLDDRERMVIRGHYGLGRPPQTLAKIGATLGLSAERARQIEVDALKKLRATLTASAPCSG